MCRYHPSRPADSCKTNASARRRPGDRLELQRATRRSCWRINRSAAAWSAKTLPDWNVKQTLRQKGWWRLGRSSTSYSPATTSKRRLRIGIRVLLVKPSLVQDFHYKFWRRTLEKRLLSSFSSTMRQLASRVGSDICSLVLLPFWITFSGPDIRASLTSTSKLNEINYAALQCFR